MIVEEYNPDDFKITIKITEKAKEKIDQLKSEKDLYFRAYITGGGCSGLKYGFKFEQEKLEDDYIVDGNSTEILIDPISYEYLSNSEIDYEDSLFGSSFFIKNPNAKSTCGCNMSFSI